MSYSTKNYTEQGGEKTVIGGELEIKEGASVKGLPSIENQAVSSASTVAGLKDNFNALLSKLKDAGYMTLDQWNVSVSKIPSPSGEEFVLNQSKVSDISIEAGIITVVVDVDELVAFPRSNPQQGTHKWIGIEITSGLPDITAIKYNGTQLTSADVDEATAVGSSAGDIVMWLKCDEIIENPKVFTLWASGYGEKSFTVIIEAPEQS
ncbi:MAG: hypothetical protein BWY74_03775 [Firmicutes bacterium ADurb.Bin419]|nr:MAG: hypothetical protein BWY74_03775 [Firmicutes bacterium ADurb.Bin419]